MPTLAESLRRTQKTVERRAHKVADVASRKTQVEDKKRWDAYVTKVRSTLTEKAKKAAKDGQDYIRIECPGDLSGAHREKLMKLFESKGFWVLEDTRKYYPSDDSPEEVLFAFIVGWGEKPTYSAGFNSGWNYR